MGLRSTAATSWGTLTPASGSFSMLNTTKFTVAGWFQTDDLTASRSFWGLGLTGANDRVFGGHDVSTGFYVAAYESAGNTYRSFTTASVKAPTGVWLYSVQMVDLTRGTEDVFSALIMANGLLDNSATEAHDPSDTGALSLPAASTFMVLGDQDGDASRGSAAYVRLFTGYPSMQELSDSMWSRTCPARLRGRCLVDLPLEVGVDNVGLLGGTLALTGTIGLAGSPPLIGRQRGPVAVQSYVGRANPTVVMSSVLSARRRRAA